MTDIFTTTTDALPPAVRRASWLPHLLIITLVWTAWAAMMQHGDRWALFADYWFMSVTMALGSFIAGATSEGGGAVAFPIMTLGFGMEPHVARDFALMIQSVGMVAAALVIVFLRIAVEWRAIICAGLGGALGGGVAMDAWSYWWVCVPVVVVGAPVGARCICNRSRHFVAGFLYCSISAQYIWALVVIPQSPGLLLFNASVVVVATLFFSVLSRYGNRRAGLLQTAVPLPEVR